MIRSLIVKGLFGRFNYNVNKRTAKLMVLGKHRTGRCAKR